VLSAHLLVKTTPTSAIIGALQWWLSPLKILGFSSKRFTVRLALVLDTVQSVQKIQTQTQISNTKNPIQNIADKVSLLFLRVLEHAENAPLHQLNISNLTTPPLWQWAYPLILLILIGFGL